MAIVFANGWELNATSTHYVGAGWSVSAGHPDAQEGTTTHQHPLGYGGGARSLQCAETQWIETLIPSFSAPNLGTLSTSVHAGTTWVAGAEFLRVVDSAGDAMLEVNSADSSDSSRLTLLHAGVTLATTTARLSLQTWYRLQIRWQISGPLLTGRLFVNGTQRASGSTALSTGITAAGIRWGGASLGNTSHDHTVVFDTVDAVTTQELWLQGLYPNADDTDGAWTPNPAGPQLWPTVEDASDSSFAETTSVSAFNVNLQDRSDVHADWTAPEVLAVVVRCAANGDGTLTDGQARVHLGASQVAGLTVGVPAAGGMAESLATTKPGGGVWAATDLDNVRAGYSAG